MISRETFSNAKSLINGQFHSNNELPLPRGTSNVVYSERELLFIKEPSFQKTTFILQADVTQSSHPENFTSVRPELPTELHYTDVALSIA